MAPNSASDPFALLEQDHRDVERLLDELSGAWNEERESAMGRLQEALSVHFDFEESEIYPLVARLIGAPLADERHTGNAAVRDALARAEDPAADESTLADLRAALAHHVEVEREDFPRLRDEVGPGEQEHLSAALEALREAAR
jgi:hemerythrin superfamily protein